MTSKAYLTAITRTSPSAPCRWIFENGLLVGKKLDYGCGKGFDADHYGMDKYDPHYFKTLPTSTYDTIVCTYVLNVISEPQGEFILKMTKKLLNPGGNVYFTVRRDITKPRISARGTFQRSVTLDLEILRETSKFCIYHMPE